MPPVILFFSETSKEMIKELQMYHCLDELLVFHEQEVPIQKVPGFLLRKKDQ